MQGVFVDRRDHRVGAVVVFVREFDREVGVVEDDERQVSASHLEVGEAVVRVDGVEDGAAVGRGVVRHATSLCSDVARVNRYDPRSLPTLNPQVNRVKSTCGREVERQGLARQKPLPVSTLR